MIGKQIVVPDLRQSTDENSVAYTEGVVSEIHLLNGDEPDIVTVDLTNGGRMYLDLIDLAASNQSLVEEGNV